MNNDTQKKVPYIITDTRGMPAKLAQEQWQERINILFDARLRDTQGQGVFSRVEACMIDQLALGSAQFGPQAFDRPTSKIGRDGLDHIMFQFYLKGHCRERNNKHARDTMPGDLWITDLSQTLATEVSSASNICLIIPRHLISPLLTQADIHHQRIIKGNEAIAYLLKSHMQSLLRVAPDMSIAESRLMTMPTVQLAAATLNNSQTEHCSPGVIFGIKREIIRYIEQNLGDPHLCTNSIAQAFRISARKLQYLFEADEGVSDFIQQTRLRRSRSLLACKTQQEISIATLAKQCGFAYLQSFSRAFRREFGLSPRSFRILARQRTTLPPCQEWDNLSWHQWISQMR